LRRRVGRRGRGRRGRCGSGRRRACRRPGRGRARRWPGRWRAGRSRGRRGRTTARRARARRGRRPRAAYRARRFYGRAGSERHRRPSDEPAPARGPARTRALALPVALAQVDDGRYDDPAERVDARWLLEGLGGAREGADPKVRGRRGRGRRRDDARSQRCRSAVTVAHDLWTFSATVKPFYHAGWIPKLQASSTRFFPAAFARYSAPSAARSSPSTVPVGGYDATPKLPVT
jgi:hypothetical protein